MTRILFRDAERFLSIVPGDKALRLSDGREVRSLRDLEQAFDAMTPETFNSHVRGEKNDFSSWVKDVIGDTLLAQELASCSNRMQSARKVALRIVFLRRKLS